MENDEMINDAAVARDFYERLYGMTFRLFLDANGEPDDDNGIELRLAATVGEKALFETADHSALVPATTVAELRAEVAYYKENFLSCMATLNAINDAITEADEEGRGFVPVHQLTAALTKESP